MTAALAHYTPPPDLRRFMPRRPALPEPAPLNPAEALATLERLRASLRRAWAVFGPVVTRGRGEPNHAELALAASERAQGAANVYHRVHAEYHVLRRRCLGFAGTTHRDTFTEPAEQGELPLHAPAPAPPPAPTPQAWDTWMD